MRSFRALRLRDRPDFPSRRRFTGAPPNIHWKTGTSYGHRDAWSAGSNASFTAVIWLGNFDNTPSVHLVGAEVHVAQVKHHDAAHVIDGHPVEGDILVAVLVVRDGGVRPADERRVGLGHALGQTGAA